jgi:hypothetical protein
MLEDTYPHSPLSKEVLATIGSRLENFEARSIQIPQVSFLSAKHNYSIHQGKQWFLALEFQIPCKFYDPHETILPDVL